MAFDFAMVLGFVIVSAAALFVFLLMGRFLRPNAPKPEKLTTYECGEPAVGPAWFNLNNRFYVVALVFVALDVAVALAIPVVVVFRDAIRSGTGWVAFAALAAFLLILLVALVYVWARAI